MPRTRSRAFRKNDNAHCGRKNGTRARQLLGCQRFGHPPRVPLLNALYGQEGSQYQNHFRPPFKLLKQEKKEGQTLKTYEKKPQTPIRGGCKARRSPRGPRHGCGRSPRAGIRSS